MYSQLNIRFRVNIHELVETERVVQNVEVYVQTAQERYEWFRFLILKRF